MSTNGINKWAFAALLSSLAVLHVAHVAANLWTAYRLDGMIKILVQQSQSIREVHDRVEYLEDWLPANFKREILIHRFENSKGERSPNLSDVWVPDTAGD